MTDTLYTDRAYEHVVLTRHGRLLEVRLHSDGGPLRWGFGPHAELSRVFRDIARDREVHVVILTGTGDDFSGPRASEGVEKGFHSMPPERWEELHADGIELIDSLLSVQALVISAVNGPALRHCELALLGDIVLAADTAEFQDSAHFVDGLTPGDGVNVITALAMGTTRAKYFHLMGEVLTAQDARLAGLVNEVVAPDDLMPRAREIAQKLLRQRPMVIRHTRLLHTLELRQKMLGMVSYGLALEGLDIADAHDHDTDH